MKWIILTIGVLAVTALIEAQPSFAYYEGPWCAYKRGSRGASSRCDLPNYEACRTEIRATPGSWCTENPRYVAAAAQPRKTKRSVGPVL
jgi:hypothetical protein